MVVARRVVAALAVVVLLLLAWTALALLRARTDLEGARLSLEAARTEGTSPGDVRAALADAENDLRQATASTGALGPALIAHVPLLGRTVTAVDATGAAALEVVSAGRSALLRIDRAGPLLSAGRVDVAALDEASAGLRQAARRSEEPVRDLEQAPTSMVPGVVGRAVQDARDELGAAPARFAQAAAALDAVARLADGDPQRLLVVLQNNAELRGTGGLVTVFAEATVGDGVLRVGPFTDVEDVADPSASARPVPVPADYRELWGPFLAGTTLWKNVNMEPDVPTASAVLAAVADESTGRRPDGVLWLDARTMALVVGATGPVPLVDGGTLTGDNAVRTLLSEAYQGVPDDRSGQALRRARLRGTADAVLGRLLGGGADPRRLGEALARAASGRHLALWSARSDQQARYRAAGLDAPVRAGAGDLVSPTTQNLGGGRREGNKLDYYSRRQVTVDVTVGARTAQVRQKVELRNTAPRDGLPDYVAGYDRPGVNAFHLSIPVPEGARRLRFSRGTTALQVQTRRERDHLVLTDLQSLPPGASGDWTVRYELPLTRGRYALTVVPQPLAVDAGLALDVHAAPGLTLRPQPGDDGALRSSGALDAVRHVDVAVERSGWWSRARASLSRFWSEPVAL